MPVATAQISELLAKASQGFTYTSAIVAVLTIVLLIESPSIVSVSGELFRSFFRPSEWFDLETRREFTSQRNIVAFLSSFAVSFLLLRLGLCKGDIVNTHSFEFSFACMWGLIVIYFLLRGIVLAILSGVTGEKDTFRYLYNNSLSFFILFTLALAIITVLHLIFPSFDGKALMTTFIIVSVVINLCSDIMASVAISDGGFSFFFGFLYLCALEILPAAVFIKVAITF
jgi:hypothetical protein